MDFDFDESQRTVQDLARCVFSRANAAPEHVREVWRELGRSQLLGVALPEAVGGSDAGLVALCLVLQQAGRAANLAPLIPALVLGGIPIEPLQERLSAVCSGSSIVCGSLGASFSARKLGDEYLLSGSEDCIEALPLADAVVVAAHNEQGARLLFLLDPYARGVSIAEQRVASGCALGSLQLTDARAEVLCEPARSEPLIERVLDTAYLAQSAYDLGLCETALELTARYAGERQQFGRAIGTFQAVTQRIADMHIAVETIRLTLWRAAWLADRELLAAREAIAVARGIAAQASHQVLCAAQHIHAGMGFAREYPLHRYFLASKQNELRLGGAAFHIARLGKLLSTGRVSRLGAGLQGL
jgi:3-oxocholest-4-en-26-oyl-CoA dehydrogenase beta subunit